MCTMIMREVLKMSEEKKETKIMDTKSSIKMPETTEMFDSGIGSAISDVIKGYLDNEHTKIIRLSEVLTIEEAEQFATFYTIGTRYKDFSHLSEFVVNNMLFRMAKDRQHIDKLNDALKSASGYNLISGDISSAESTNKHRGIRKGLARLFGRE